MCRMFAVSAARPIEINRELEDFFAAAVLHKHGWGYADFSRRKVFVKREAVAAYESEYLKELLAKPFFAENAFFHIRYATVGSVRVENCHPMTAMDVTGRIWTLIHNGTIFHSDEIEKYYYEQRGDTDTERLLLYIVAGINDRVRGGRDFSNDDARFDYITDILTKVAKGNKINIVLSDGEYLYVHGNAPEGNRLLGESSRNDYLYERDENGIALISTVPLYEAGGRWTPLPPNTVIAYKDGVRVRESEPHGFAYVENEEDIKHLYHGFSGL
jgi:glutamine amidotransferase